MSGIRTCSPAAPHMWFGQDSSRQDADSCGVDPTRPMQVDKLSMDRVTVFPDGELNVEALAAVPGSAAFMRPMAASRGMRGSTVLPGGVGNAAVAGPPHPVRVPPGMPGAGGVRQSGGRVGQRPPTGGAPDARYAQVGMVFWDGVCKRGMHDCAPGCCILGSVRAKCAA